ncbi:MAG TPA: aldose epimerase family protein [Woeseiaceae bacterium]|nr:aldose epimerase family protein [Woeseiaceae bacterium]
MRSASFVRKIHAPVPLAVFSLCAAGLCAAGLCAAGKAGAAEARREDFGATADGTRVTAVRLSNDAGYSVRVLSLGATIQSLEVPDREGNIADVVLGYPTAAEYLDKPRYFGSTVGRYANRIGAARFELDGRTYELEANDGRNHLHGGLEGLDKLHWTVESAESGTPARAVFRVVSPDGAGGYPGTLAVLAEYSLADSGELRIAYEATTDETTIVNITNHAYFNLAGADGGHGILDHELTIHADRYTPVDETLIPTGELAGVAGTAFDFRAPRRIGDEVRDASDPQLVYGRGYDHNFVLNDADGTLRPAAVLHDPASGRTMELLTTAPGLQFYSGNFLDGLTVGKNERMYRQGDALCLEPQVFPDAPNQPGFPSARLEPGETYSNVMVLRFSTDGDRTGDDRTGGDQTDDDNR